MHSLLFATAAIVIKVVTVMELVIFRPLISHHRLFFGETRMMPDFHVPDFWKISNVMRKYFAIL